MQSVGLRVVGEQDGSYLLTRTASNSSEYVPAENEAIELVDALTD